MLAMSTLRNKGDDGYKLSEKWKTKIWNTLETYLPASFANSLDAARIALAAIKNERILAGIFSSGVKDRHDQNENFVESIADTDEDVIFIPIHCDGQCCCARLSSDTSPSLRIRKLIEYLVSDRQAKIDAHLDQRYKLEVAFSDLHVDCVHEDEPGCVPVTPNDQLVAGGQAELDDVLLTRLERDVRIANFNYGANQRDARGLNAFCEVEVSEDGKIISTATPHWRHAGDKTKSALDCSRFCFGIAPLFDHTLPHHIPGYAQLEFDYKADYENGLAEANIKRSYVSGKELSPEFDALTEKLGSSFAAAKSWMMDVLSKFNINEYWREVKRVKQLVVDRHKISQLSSADRALIMNDKAVRLGTNGFADGKIEPLSIKRSILRESELGPGKPMHFCLAPGCGTKWAQEEHLRRHLRTHTKETPYACTAAGCHAAFTRESNLKKHRWLHVPKRLWPFKCNICGETFTKSDNLKVHMRSHTGEKPYKCGWIGCNKRFTTSQNRKTHYDNVHLKKKDHKCPVCLTDFSRYANVKRHVEKKHPLFLHLV